MYNMKNLHVSALKVKCRYVKKTSQFNIKVIYHGLQEAW
jgi:hypothetical protein